MAVTWDPAHKSTGITLSNGNLTATDTSGLVANHSVLCTTSIPASGLWVAEFTYPTVTGGSDGPIIGVCTISQNVESYLGDSTNGVGCASGTASGHGYILFNNVGLSTTQAIPVSGNVMGLCIDPANAGLYYRVQGGNWNNNPAADPTTNTGSIALSVTGTIFFAGGVLFDGSTSLVVTANFGATPFLFTQPVGAQSLDNFPMAQAVM